MHNKPNHKHRNNTLFLHEVVDEIQDLDHLPRAADLRLVQSHLLYVVFAEEVDGEIVSILPLPNAVVGVLHMMIIAEVVHEVVLHRLEKVVLHHEVQYENLPLWQN